MGTTPDQSAVVTFLQQAAAEAGADASAAGSALEFSRGGKVFAALTGGPLEVHLDPEVAEAALNTQGTQPSKRGDGWVQLAVQPDQPHDLDRARAWFLSAWRTAAG